MSLIHSNSAVRIRPPSQLTQQKWFAEDFNTRKTFALPEAAVAILLYCISPQEKNVLITEIAKSYQIDTLLIEKLISELMTKDLISTQQKLTDRLLNSELFNEQYPLWQQYHWGSAAEYHFYTYDYPFLDYTEGADGWHIANQRMNEYSAKEIDFYRIKTYPENYKRVFLLDPFNLQTTELYSTANEDISMQELFNILCYSFAKTATAPIRWRGAPLIRRTSPSGGSRHPTEGYCIVNRVCELENGIYHIQMDPFNLVQLNNNKVDLFQLFPDFCNYNSEDIAAIIILTSVFERNMYRYREPRTFRTVHIDAGHILGTIELIASYFGLKTKSTTHFNDQDIEQLIDINGLEEGVMICVALFKKTDEDCYD